MRMPHSEDNKKKTLLLVEGSNDKALLNILALDLDLVNFLDVRSIGGIDNLKNHLQSIKNDLQDYDFSNLGLIIDIDESEITEKINYIENSLKILNFEFNNFDENILETILIAEDALEIKVKVFFMSASNKKGELIDLLKEIKLQPSDISDCAIKCLKKKGDSNDKELMDDWLHLYLKWDCSSRKDRKNGSKIGLDKEETKVRIKEMFYLQSEKLNPLKTYLTQFSN